MLRVDTCSHIPKKGRCRRNGKAVAIKRKAPVAVKTFKSSKSSKKILAEATMQQTCAMVDASPNILGVHLKEKYIVMQALHSLPAETYRNQDMPETLQLLCNPERGSR